MATERKPVPKVRAERIELTNAVCPKCDGPIAYTPTRWLFCPRCKATKLGTGAPIGPPDAPRENPDAVQKWIAAARRLSAASKRDREVCRLLRTAPAEFVADLRRDRLRTRRACERAAVVASRLRVAAFGASPL